MTTTVTQENAETTKSSNRIQRLAWIIVMVSFAVFCSGSIAVSGGVYFFLFRSTLPMAVTAEVSRGSAGFSAVDYSQTLTTNDVPIAITDRPSVLSTDTLSQALLSFSIPTPSQELETSADTVLGTITLKNNSSITLQNARRPRFSWSDGAYVIDFLNFSGEADIVVTSPEDIPLQLRIRTNRGNATYRITTNGRYTIIANETQIQIITYEGRALLISPQSNNNRLTVTGEQATLLTGSNLPVVTSAPINLIENGLFSFDFAVTETGEAIVPQRWACFDRLNSPPGDWSVDTWEGRHAIRLIREVGDTSRQTGCSQQLNVNVENYSYLELQATVSLNFQSLVNCGDVGSECPMMIFIDYLDAEGQDRTWYQGLFYDFNSQSPAPIVCTACGQGFEHRPVDQQVWYTFESGNLFNSLPEEAQPVSILDVEFYASGHRYDVFISEIALFAGSEQVVPPRPSDS